jgi:hypothetical protein
VLVEVLGEIVARVGTETEMPLTLMGLALPTFLSLKLALA